jgi:hypothetical protein
MQCFIKKHSTEAPFILQKVTIYQIKFDANKILKRPEVISQESKGRVKNNLITNFKQYPAS